MSNRKTIFGWRAFVCAVIAALGLSSVVATGGCVATVGPPAEEVAVAPDPAVDWWYDGTYTYYYSDGRYFYYGVDGAVVWCPFGWYPHPEWHRVGYPHFYRYPYGRGFHRR